MTFDEWVASLPAEIKGDTLWKPVLSIFAWFGTRESRLVLQIPPHPQRRSRAPSYFTFDANY